MSDGTVTTRPRRTGWRPGAVEVLLVVLVGLLLAQHWLAGLFTSPAWQAGATVFVSIVVQALPFLVLGTVLSGLITAYVPPEFFARALPKHPVAAVPVAGLAGLAIPGCECASVPVAGGLMARGVTPAAALAFLLSSPAINPVVLSICSEADAFVAASLGPFSLTARLAFLVVGPMVDIKLFALQAGTFGRAFAVRFAPTTFVVGILVSALVGMWLL